MRTVEYLDCYSSRDAQKTPQDHDKKKEYDKDNYTVSTKLFTTRFENIVETIHWFSKVLR